MTHPVRPSPVSLEAYPIAYDATPIPLFSRLRTLTGAILLDSGSPSPQAGRFDIFSALPLATLEVDINGEVACSAVPSSLRGDPIKAQRYLLDSLALDTHSVPAHLPFKAGLMGAWSYEFGRHLEGLPSSMQTLSPIACVGLYDWAVILDHQLQQGWLVATPERRRAVLPILNGDNVTTRGFRLTGPFTGIWSQQQYTHAFDDVQAYIRSGDCYQINLTQAFSATYEGDEWTAYLRLREATPSPFSAFMKAGDSWLLSVSPERFITLDQDGVKAQPIKGTRPRGYTPEQDAALAHELEHSLKDRAENVMIVDLLRNDLGRVCTPGSVRVPELVKRISYANVHHLVSTVVGTLAPQQDALDVLTASLPGGSITGAPKHRAMEIIDELEAGSRNYYCGSIGYIDISGHMDTSITIRTAVASAGEISLWGGGGIVADSDCQEEYAESLAKINRLMEALTGHDSESFQAGME